MSDPFVTVQASQSDELSELTQLLKATYAELIAERERGVPEISALQLALQEARNTLDKIDNDYTQLKNQASEIKQAIDTVKQEYYQLPGIDKSADWARLESTVQEHANELGQLEEKIAKLFPDRLQAQGEYQTARHRVEAFYSGVYDRPVDEDPRIIHLKQTIANLESESREIPS